MATNDFSLFGWMLPKQYFDDFGLGVLLIVVIGYLLLFILIHKLMKRFLNQERWHKYVRRSVWLSIFTLMFFDPIYYFFWIEHGMCKADRERVYPAPPASYVVAGPEANKELLYEANAKLNTILNGKNKYTYYYGCQYRGSSKLQLCIIQGLTPSDEEKKLPFGFFKESRFARDSSSEINKYFDSYSYQPNGHFLTKIIFGYKINFLNYEDLFSCASINHSTQLPIILDKEIR